MGNDDDVKALGELSDGTLRVLLMTQRRLEEHLAGSEEFDPDKAGEVAKFARAVATAMKEVRVFQESIVSEVEEGSDEETWQVMAGWFAGLDTARQREYFSGLVLEVPREERRQLIQAAVDKFKADGGSGDAAKDKP